MHGATAEDRSAPDDVALPPPRGTGTHVAKIAAGGRVIYLGRHKTKEEARQVEHAARAEYARTGRVEHARSTYRKPSQHRDEAVYAEQLVSGRRLATSPEHVVMHAVLRQALDDLTDTNVGVRHAALRWFRASDRRDHVFSFATICDELELRPADVLHLTRGVRGPDPSRAIWEEAPVVRGQVEVEDGTAGVQGFRCGSGDARQRRSAWGGHEGGATAAGARGWTSGARDSAAQRRGSSRHDR